jgi:hypothetical protein
LSEVTAIERHIDDLLALDDLAERRGGGVQGGRNGRNFDRLLNGGRRQRKVERGALTHQHLDVFPDRSSEAILRN